MAIVEEKIIEQARSQERQRVREALKAEGERLAFHSQTALETIWINSTMRSLLAVLDTLEDPDG